MIDGLRSETEQPPSVCLLRFHMTVERQLGPECRSEPGWHVKVGLCQCNPSFVPKKKEERRKWPGSLVNMLQNMRFALGTQRIEEKKFTFHTLC